jgi:hypothetical protein
MMPGGTVLPKVLYVTIRLGNETRMNWPTKEGRLVWVVWCGLLCVIVIRLYRVREVS